MGDEEKVRMCQTVSCPVTLLTGFTDDPDSPFYSEQTLTREEYLCASASTDGEALKKLAQRVNRWGTSMHQKLFLPCDPGSDVQQGAVYVIKKPRAVGNENAVSIRRFP